MLPTEQTWAAAVRTGAVVGLAGTALLLVFARWVGFAVVEPSRHRLASVASLVVLLAVPAAVTVRVRLVAPAVLAALGVAWVATDLGTADPTEDPSGAFDELPTYAPHVAAAMALAGALEYAVAVLHSRFAATWTTAVLAAAVVSFLATALVLRVQTGEFGVLLSPITVAIFGAPAAILVGVPTALLVRFGLVTPALVGTAVVATFRPRESEVPLGEPCVGYLGFAPLWFPLVLVAAGLEYGLRFVASG